MIEVSPQSGHGLTQNLIMRAEGPEKLSAGTSRQSRPKGGVAASISMYLFAIRVPKQIIIHRASVPKLSYSQFWFFNINICSSNRWEICLQWIYYKLLSNFWSIFSNYSPNFVKFPPYFLFNIKKLTKIDSYIAGIGKIFKGNIYLNLNCKEFHSYNNL